MSVRAKLLVMITFVALVPLSFSAYTTLGLHQEALDQKIAEVHVRSAKYGAKIVEANLERMLGGLATTIESSIRWAELSASEREGALWLLQGQLASIVGVALLDGAGRVLADTAHEPGAHTTLSEADLQLLVAGLPLQRALAQGQAHGEPLRIASGIALPIGYRVPGPSGPEVVLIGYSLHDACAELEKERLERSLVALVDARAERVCTFPASDNAGPLPAELREALARDDRGSIRYSRGDGTEMLAAAASTPWGFRVIVAQPARELFAPSARMRLESLLWIAIGVLAAVGAGLVLARGISLPLARLTRGADQMARGDFSVRLEVQGKDELAGVSAAFNRMCGEIETRQREIRAWNEELQTRVELKTDELQTAQHALLESRKVAAMATLAAGVAHEINNPLTGVIGLTQVLLQRSRKLQDANADAELLRSVEREALRVRDIVTKMQALSQVKQSGTHRELRTAELVLELLALRQERLREAQVTLEQQVSSDVPNIVGDRAQLTHVILELIDNAVRAMRGHNGKLTVTLDALDAELVRLRVSDTGRGIAEEHMDKVFEPFFTTKDDWHGQGLGLTAAHQIIEAHHGTIKLESRVSRGTTVTVMLPSKRSGAHLS